MSTELTMPTQKLAKCFSELALLIPKGSKGLPVGIDLQAGILSIYHNAGTVYLKQLDVNSQDTAHCTVLFYDISDLLISTGIAETKVTFQENGVRVYNDIVDLFLRHGYSTIEYPDLPRDGYVLLPASGWNSNLQTVLNMGLDKLYMKSTPITVASGTSVLKYPNTWVRCRTMGLNLNRVIDIEHIRLLNKFLPNQYQLLGNDSVLFRRDDAYLLLPCRQPNDLADTDNFIQTALSKMSEPIDVYVAHYLNSIRSLSKLSNKSVCNLVLFENGMKTVIEESGAGMSVLCGEAGKVIGTVQIPLNAWLVFLRALGTDRIQVLIGGDILCLRNQFLVILTHVRN